MPPHCDSLSGPVVKMAKRALETGNVNLILPYVPKESEGEVVAAFNKVLPLHKQPNGAHEIADMFFFETVVRLHRAGEGAPAAPPRIDLYQKGSFLLRAKPSPLPRPQNSLPGQLSMLEAEPERLGRRVAPGQHAQRDLRAIAVKSASHESAALAQNAHDFAGVGLAARLAHHLASKCRQLVFVVNLDQ